MYALFFLFHVFGTCIFNYSGYIKGNRYTLLPSYGFENGGEYQFELSTQSFSGVSILFLPYSKSQWIISHRSGLKGFCDGKSRGKYDNITLSTFTNKNKSQIFISGKQNKSVLQPLLANCNYSTIFIRGLYRNPHSYLDSRNNVYMWGNLLLSFLWISVGILFFVNTILNSHFLIFLQSSIILTICLKSITFILFSSFWARISSKGTYSTSFHYFISILSIIGNSFLLAVISLAAHGYGSYRDIISNSELHQIFWPCLNISFVLFLMFNVDGILSTLSYYIFVFQSIKFARTIFQAAQSGEHFLASASGPAAPQQISRQYLLAIKFSWSILSWIVFMFFLFSFISIAQLNKSWIDFLIEIFLFIPCLIFANFFIIKKEHYPNENVEDQEDEEERKEIPFTIAYSEEPNTTDLVFLDSYNLV